MSEQPPRTPFTPLYTPELSRDANGIILYCDAQGNWLSYNGPLPTLQQPMPERTGPQPSYVPQNNLSHGGPSSPIEHAFPQQPEYQFALRPVVGSSSAPIPIDPALVPFPGGADADLRHSPTIANAIGLKPAEKVAGSRRKGKGRERADPKGKKRQRASYGSDNNTEPVAKRGRPQGSANYSKDSAFDPEAQKNRDDTRAHRSFENTQFLAVSQQLRDAQATAENLRSENNVLRNRIHDIERQLERSELRHEMMGYDSGRRARSPSRSRWGRSASRSRRGCSASHSHRRSRSLHRHRVPGYRSHKRDPGIDRVNGKIRSETVFPEGGAATYFISDPSTDEYYNNDDDENSNPFRLDRPWEDP
ncbi:hypothetical protein C8R45DRAFT_1134637 [Mycena sanguinolenta]|nr:hypothetical protein C8R45DRAFT_1134637 [Mycena sanguinolenta]